MKPGLLFTVFTAMLLVGCANSNNLSTKVQTLAVQSGTTKPTVVIAPQKANAFVAAASRQTSFVEAEVRNGTADSLAQFGRFGPPQGRGSDATIVFESIRHGVTLVGNGQYAPVVDAVVRVVGPDGKTLATRRQSATSGGLHSLQDYANDAERYRSGISVAAKKLGMEIAGGL